MSVLVEARGLGIRYYLRKRGARSIRRFLLDSLSFGLSRVTAVTGRDRGAAREAAREAAQDTTPDARPDATQLAAQGTAQAGQDEAGGRFDGDLFWALRGVDLSLAEGEVLGIVGPNGAGKSTLCKVIAGILHPDEGTLSVEGQVCPLLGLGAGFVADLSGRDNIRISGALLGLEAEEIEAREEEIIRFADIGAFIDQPVRRYSDGMKSRLAFAVATSVEPSVLVLDEVLSVGDVSFQAKCLERIRALMEEARAIVFVSHDLDSVRELCGKVIWLDEGRMRMAGEAAAVLAEYGAACGRRGGAAGE